MVHAALNEWRANLYGPARRLFQEAQVRQSEAGLSARELLYWTWADCELEQGNVKRCLRICSQGLLHCRKRPSSLRLLEARVRLFSAALPALVCLHICAVPYCRPPFSKPQHLNAFQVRIS
jgi:hypothetical protein